VDLAALSGRRWLSLSVVNTIDDLTCETLACGRIKSLTFFRTIRAWEVEKSFTIHTTVAVFAYLLLLKDQRKNGPVSARCAASQNQRRKPGRHRWIRIRGIRPSRLGRAQDAVREQMGFALVARHKSLAIDLYRLDGVNYILNGDWTSFGGRFVDLHGPCAPAMAWRVADANHALAHALERGAQPYNDEAGAKSIDAPAILGIGGSLIYFIDTFGAKGSPYEAEFDWVGERDPGPAGYGIDYIDHLTNNVFRGAMDR
jgi:hypothetical protein